MTNKIARKITDRWLKVMRIAIAERWLGVSNKTQFAAELKMIPQQIYLIESRPDRYVTIEQVFNMCVIFGASPNYIILGLGPMRMDQVKSLEDRIKIIEKATADFKKANNFQRLK